MKSDKEIPKRQTIFLTRNGRTFYDCSLPGVGWGEVRGRVGRVLCRLQNKQIRLPWNADFNNFNKTAPKATDLIFAGAVDL